MKKIVGVVLIALGVAMTATGVVGSTTEGVTPESVSIKEIEAGRRPNKEREYWKITGAQRVEGKSSSMDSVTSETWIPYASSRDAAWTDIKLVARFEHPKSTFDEAMHTDEPAGAVGTDEEWGSIPYSTLNKSARDKKRVLVLHVGEKPSNTPFLAIGGALLAFVGMFLVRNPRKRAPSRSPPEETES